MQLWPIQNDKMVKRCNDGRTTPTISFVLRSICYYCFLWKPIGAECNVRPPDSACQRERVPITYIEVNAVTMDEAFSEANLLTNWFDEKEGIVCFNNKYLDLTGFGRNITESAIVWLCNACPFPIWIRKLNSKETRQLGQLPSRPNPNPSQLIT